jgi:hypothetical protein
MHERLADEIRRVVAGMDEQDNQQGETDTERPGQDAAEEIQDIYVLVVREREEEAAQTQVVESAPPQQVKQRFAYVTLCIVLLCSLPMLASIAFQAYGLLNPPTATITIVPKSQTVTLSSTLRLGRLLSPITVSQSQTVPTTGKGHQDAKAATGSITFYNGQFTQVTVSAGTLLTGANGIQVITEQEAAIPAANPPMFGQATVSAHATKTGSRGNIPAYNISVACCAVSVLAKNTTPFQGGQNARDFQTVSKRDIDATANPLKTTLAQSITGAFQGQVTPTEQLYMLPCTSQVTSDHQPGQEATIVNVTVSATCSAVAYTSQALAEKVTALLSTQAVKKLGTGYSLIGDVEVSVKQATVTRTTTPLVFLSFFSQGTWVYTLNTSEQQRIKQLIAGKTKQAALYILLSVPGIERVSMSWDENTKLPRDSRSIKLVLIIAIEGNEKP